MTMPSPQQLQIIFTGFAGALLLALLTATIESLFTRRALGLRRRRGVLLGTAILADVLRLLSKSTPARGPRYAVGVGVVLVPTVLLVGGLPAGGWLGGLPVTATATERLLGLAGLLAVVPFALFALATTVTPARRQPLAAVILPLVGTQVTLVLCVAACIVAGDTEAGFQTRVLGSWPLWHHPCGGFAFLGALAALSAAYRQAMEGTGVGRLNPGLIDGPGAGVLLLRLSRPLLIGAASALAVHLYLGLAPGVTQLPDVAIWAGVTLWVTLVFLLQAAITKADADGLSRLVWRRLLPLAGIDVLWSLVRVSGGVPWS